MGAYDQSAMRAAAHASAGTLPPDSNVAQSIPELVRQLTSDTVGLIQSEIRLAKAELRVAATDLAQDGIKIALGAGFMMISSLALLTAAVIGLALVLGGRYWLSALIIGAVLFVVGAALVAQAIHDLKSRRRTMPQTRQSLNDDVRWVKRQVAVVKEEVKRDDLPPARHQGQVERTYEEER